MDERRFSYEVSDESRRVMLRGDLDEIAAIEMRNLLSGLSESLTRDLTVDLTDVDLFPSSAVGVLASAQDKARKQGATLSLVAADGTIAARVLAICGLAYDES